MDAAFLFKGMIIGFCVAAPVGPIGILCIRKTLQYGRFSGFFSGLGAAVADTFFGGISIFGLTLVSDFLTTKRFWFHILGGFFLLLLGGRTFIAKSAEPKAISHKTLLGDFASTFFLTLANPLTILSFAAIFAGFGLSAHRANAPLLILGILLGSTLWWLILSEGVTLFRKKLSHKVMTWVNRIAGIIIIGFGIAAIGLI